MFLIVYIYRLHIHKLQWSQKLPREKKYWATHVTSNYNASPIYLNGNIFFFSAKGEVVVIKAGRKYEVVAKSQMDSGIWATPLS